MSFECKNFTIRSWWSLVEELTENLHRLIAQLRRDRGAFTDRHMILNSEAPGLTCVVWRHGGPACHEIAGLTRDERGGLVVNFRKGDPTGRDLNGRAIWAKEISVEVRLPEAHAKQWGETMWWDSRTGHRRRVQVRAKRALRELRQAERERLKDHPDRRPLAPPRIWIDPKHTPQEVTLFSLLLILWQEKLVEFDPEKSPEAWAWVKKFLRTYDDAQLFMILAKLQDYYVQAEDWRGLRKYIGQTIRSLSRQTKKIEGAKAGGDVDLLKKSLECAWWPQKAGETPRLGSGGWFQVASDLQKLSEHEKEKAQRKRAAQETIRDKIFPTFADIYREAERGWNKSPLTSASRFILLAAFPGLRHHLEGEGLGGQNENL